MLTLYFAEILDYSNKPVMKLQYTASAKHSAMLATQFVRDVPLLAFAILTLHTY
jgi:hypothetical protein